MSSELTAVYIAIGYEGARALDKERYERQADMSNGHIGGVSFDELLAHAKDVTLKWIDQNRLEYNAITKAIHEK